MIRILPGRGVIELQAWCFHGAERQLPKIRLDVRRYRLFCSSRKSKVDVAALKKNIFVGKKH